MIPTRSLCALLIVATVAAYPQSTNTAVDAAFRKFWAAKSPAEAEKSTKDVVKTGVTFDEAFRRLKDGRTYEAQPQGVIRSNYNAPDGVQYHYALNIPSTYDPAKRYQVRFQLHGGIGGRVLNEPRGSGEIGALAGAEQIYVIPYAWVGAAWWSDHQVLNFNTILDIIKRSYNVDENRVVVSGVSDGATGAYYIAMHDTTPYASFLPLNGSIEVLTANGIDDGAIYPNNLRNKPMFVVNGGRDRLYPTRRVEPYLQHLMRGGVQIDYQPQPDGEHNTAWWPEVKDVYETFVKTHPRDPHPDKSSWEAGDLYHARAHWLVINRIGNEAPGTKDLPDLNVMRDYDRMADFIPQAGMMFERKKMSGRVDLTRTANTVQVATSNVTAFTLLLSPDKFDLTQPVKVVANGREVFNGRVERNVETLLKWAARDNDRTMLYAAELAINLRK